MFKINKLILYNFNNESYTYQFKTGINYFKGKNSSGKTEFYRFLDYMFGSSEKMKEKPWYKDSLKKATLEIEVRDISYVLTRYLDSSQNYLYYADESSGEIIDLREYKDKLNAIFAVDMDLLKSIRKFTDQDLTYRTFTLFNFLGEKNQGAIQDFFDKCKDIKYSVKLAPILNFIFNSNLEKIHELQKELEIIQEEVKGLEEASSKYDFICTQVNKNLQKLGSKEWYTGRNASDIRKNIEDIKNMQDNEKRTVQRNISELEAMYSTVSEQIKIYENIVSDAKQFDNENKNRKFLLEKLEGLLLGTNDFNYLIEPLKDLLKELDSTISFSQYTISDKTVRELKRQRQLVKAEIEKNDSRFKCYSMEEKAKAIALIDEYLLTEVKDYDKELKEKLAKIRDIKEQIRILQNSDDIKKIREVSTYITELYTSAKGISSVVDDDIMQRGFRIKYLKKGNILQPTIERDEKDENGLERKAEENYYIGSMARHTLIQLSGYFGFLKLLLEEGRYPVIPILALDHISKPFDVSNMKAIGQIINKGLSDIGEEKLQIFVFEDKEYKALNLEPDHAENLVEDGKSGFNPFFYKEPQEDVNGVNDNLE